MNMPLLRQLIPTKLPEKPVAIVKPKVRREFIETQRKCKLCDYNLFYDENQDLVCLQHGKAGNLAIGALGNKIFGAGPRFPSMRGYDVPSEHIGPIGPTWAGGISEWRGMYGYDS